MYNQINEILYPFFEIGFLLCIVFLIIWNRVLILRVIKLRREKKYCQSRGAMKSQLAQFDAMVISQKAYLQLLLSPSFFFFRKNWQFLALSHQFYFVLADIFIQKGSKMLMRIYNIDEEGCILTGIQIMYHFLALLFTLRILLCRFDTFFTGSANQSSFVISWK